MESKRTNRMWAISLLVVVIASVILVGSNLVEVKLPDIVLRILGILDLIALFTLSFFTAKKMSRRDRA